MACLGAMRVLPPSVPIAATVVLYCVVKKCSICAANTRSVVITYVMNLLFQLTVLYCTMVFLTLVNRPCIQLPGIIYARLDMYTPFQIGFKHAVSIGIAKS